MRTRLFLITFATISTFNLSLHAAATGGATGGGASGTGGGASGAFAPATSGAGNQTTTTQNGSAGQGQVTLQNRSALGVTNALGVGANTNGLISGTNAFNAANSNAFLIQSNQFLVQSNGLIAQTNVIGVLTNQTAAQSNSIFNPTARLVPGFSQTNAGAAGTAAGTVSAGARTLPTAAMLGQDRAANQSDRTMLVQIHRGLRGVFPSPATLAGVHFQVQQGVVTAAGSVQNLEQKQQILQSVLSTPNVIQVVDQLQVRVPPGSPVSRTGFGAQPPPAVGSQVLTPTGATNQFGVNPGLFPNVPTIAITPGTR